MKIRNKIAPTLAAGLLAAGVVGAGPVLSARADAGTADICLYITSVMGSPSLANDGLMVHFYSTRTGTPIPPLYHEIDAGECSKEKYPTLLPDWFRVPGSTTSVRRTICRSQYGGYYYSSTTYSTKLVNGKLSLNCRYQYKNAAGQWVNPFA